MTPIQKLLAVVSRLRTNEKLQRGRCRECGHVLRDDVTGPVCSDECLPGYLASNF